MTAGDDVWFEKWFQADLAKSQTAHILDMFLKGLHCVTFGLDHSAFLGLDHGVSLSLDYGSALRLDHNGGCGCDVVQDGRMSLRTYF